MVYKITCISTQKYYIGVHSTNNIDDGYMGSGIEIKKHLSFCLGVHIKEIISETSDRDSALFLEKKIVNRQLLLDPLCLNIALGGAGSNINWTDHNKNPKNRHFRIKGRVAANKTAAMRKCSAETFAKTSARLHREGKICAPDWTGRSHKETTKRKIGLANAIKQAGKLNSQFGTHWFHYPLTKEVKKIKSSEVVVYTVLGWKPGRIFNKL